MTIVNKSNSPGGPKPKPTMKASREEKPSFFRPYKRSYGFWTRLGTGIGAALLIIFTVQFLYSRLPAWVHTQSTRTVSQSQLDALKADRLTRVVSSEPVANVADSFKAQLDTYWLSPQGPWLWIVLAATTLALAALCWWLMNRPKHADFLINTDAEMKKVTWTSWRELIGSTKVVIFFMFFLAFTLFFYDIVFGYLAFWLDVLKIAPLSA